MNLTQKVFPLHVLCPSCSMGGLAGSAVLGPGHRNAFFFAVHLKSGARASYRVQLSLNQALNLKKPLCKNFRGELWNKYIDQLSRYSSGAYRLWFCIRDKAVGLGFQECSSPLPPLAVLHCSDV